MTRSTRLLAIGVTVLVAALVVLLVSLQSQPDPVVVADAAPDAAAADAGDEEAAPATDAGTVGALAEDEARMPTPLEIPADHEAVAVTANYDAAVAALPVPGDRINIYGVFKNGLPEELGDELAPTGDDEEGATPEPGVVRVLSGVEVLGASGTVAEAGGGTATFVLALSPEDTERTIYLASTEEVWFTLVGADHEPVPGVGVTRDTVLDAADPS